MIDYVTRAADLRRSGVAFKAIAKHLNITVERAFDLAREGGWEKACWPKTVLRVTGDGYAFLVRDGE